MTKFVINALLCLSLSARATHCFVSSSLGHSAATFLLPKRHLQPSHRQQQQQQQQQQQPDVVVTLLQATHGADDAKNASEISHEEIADYRRGIASSGDSKGGSKSVRTILAQMPLLMLTPPPQQWQISRRRLNVVCVQFTNACFHVYYSQ
jgi:hypothetical protein